MGVAEGQKLRCSLCGKEIDDFSSYEISGEIVSVSEINFINRVREKSYVVCPDCVCDVYIGLKRANSQILRTIITKTKEFLIDYMRPLFIFLIIATPVVAKIAPDPIVFAFLGPILLITMIIGVVFFYMLIVMMYLRIPYILSLNMRHRNRKLIAKILFAVSVPLLIFSILMIMVGYVVGGSLLYEALKALKNPAVDFIAQILFYSAYKAFQNDIEIRLSSTPNIVFMIAIVSAYIAHLKIKQARCLKIKKRLKK